MFMPAYYGETANACTLDKCLEKAIEMSNWDKYYPAKDMGNGKIRAWVLHWPCSQVLYLTWILVV